MGASMDSGEWPADWAMYTGNNTGLGFDLLWLAALACAVAVLWRREPAKSPWRFPFGDTV